MRSLRPLTLVVPRARASVLSLVAAFVTALVAATLVATVPMYSSAIVDAGLQRAVADASGTERGLELSFRTSADQWADEMARVAAVAHRRFGDAGRTLAIGETDSYGFGGAIGGERAITSLAVLDPAGDMLRVVDGSPDTTPGAGRTAVLLHAGAAEELGLAAGSTLDLTSRDGDVAVEVVALFEPSDPLDPLWYDDTLVRDGVLHGNSFDEYGPFVIAQEALDGIERTMTARFRVALDAGRIDPASTDRLTAAADGFDRDVTGALEHTDVDVETGIPALLASTDEALRSTSGVVAAVLLQVAGVALYGLALAAAVLTDARRAETTLLQSRGAAPRQLALVAAGEAGILVAIAAVLAPFLAQVVIGALGRWGPIATTGLDLDAEISSSTVLAVAALAVLGIAIVTWPAGRAALVLRRDDTTNRPGTAAFLRRTGLDLVIVVLAALGLWQLTRSGAAVTSDLEGRLGTDPVLVLAPVLGIVAVSLLLMRLVHALTGAAQRAAAARRGFVPAMAGWEAARRPERTARTVVLVVLAVSVGAFAGAHAVSWETSQRDQADATVSADIAVAPDQRPSAEVDQRFLADSYLTVAGASEAMAVDEDTAALTRGTGAVPLVALDTRHLGVLRGRPDLVDGIDGGLEALAAPDDLGGVPLPDPAADLEGVIAVDVVAGDVTGTIRTAIVVLDGAGVFHYLDTASVPAADGSTPTQFVLTGAVEGEPVRIVPPLQLVEVEVTAPIVLDPQDPEVTISSLRFELSLEDLRIAGVPVDATGIRWATREIPVGSRTTRQGTASASSEGDRIGIYFDTGLARTPNSTVTGRFSTVGGAGVPGEEPLAVLPVAVTSDLLDALAIEVGGSLNVDIGGRDYDAEVIGTVDAVPFAVDAEHAVLVDHLSLAGRRYLSTGTYEAPTRWGLSAGEDQHEATSRLLDSTPFSSVEVLDRRELAADLARDPVTVGLSGSLVVALVASLVVSMVGLVLTSIAGARERRPAFAVLRALGTHRSELRRWLLLETVPLVVLATIAGLLTGIGIARLALRSLTVARDGSPAVPPPILVVPWGTLAFVVVAVLAAGLALPFATGRLLGRHRPAEELRIGDEQ